MRLMYVVQRYRCDTCGNFAVNLWICLNDRCLFIGCGEALSDHSAYHAKVRKHFASKII